MKDLIIRIIAKLTGKGFKEAEDGFVRVSERAKDAFKGVGGLIGKFGKEFIRGGLWEVGAGAAMWGVRKLQDALEQAKRAEEELIAATERWNRKLADLGRNIRINKIAVDLAQVKKHLDGVASGDISEAEHQARLNAIIRSRATGSDAARANVANIKDELAVRRMRAAALEKALAAAEAAARREEDSVGSARGLEEVKARRAAAQKLRETAEGYAKRLDDEERAIELDEARLSNARKDLADAIRREAEAADESARKRREAIKSEIESRARAVRDWLTHSGAGKLYLLNSTAQASQIKTLPALNWASKAEIHCLGCNSGVENGSGDSLAGSFYESQKVPTLGQSASSSFSSDPNKKSKWGVVLGFSDVYLWAFDEDGNKMPPVLYPKKPESSR